MVPRKGNSDNAPPRTLGTYEVLQVELSEVNTFGILLDDMVSEFPERVSSIYRIS